MLAPYIALLFCEDAMTYQGGGAALPDNLVGQLFVGTQALARPFGLQ